MSIIKTVHLISALAIFGILMYFSQPITYYITDLFPTSGAASSFIMFMFAILPAINLFGSGFRFIMSMQEGE